MVIRDPSPRSRAVARRDWRADPEASVPLARKPRRSHPRICPKGAVHVPELETIVTRATVTTGAGELAERVMTRSAPRCAKCHASGIDPVLLADFADYLSSRDLSRLLTHVNCPSGHNYAPANDPDWPQALACQLCGHVRRPRRAAPVGVRDPSALAAAGIPSSVVAAIAGHTTLRWAAPAGDVTVAKLQS